MTNISKRQKVIVGALEKKGIVPGKTYDAIQAFEIIKECATAKFDESVDISARLGIDTRKSDQTVRGSVVLPHGTGRVVRVAVFAQGANADAALAAGAD